MSSHEQQPVELMNRDAALRSLGVVQSTFGPAPVSMLERLLGPLNLDLGPFSSWVEELPADRELGAQGD